MKRLLSSLCLIAALIIGSSAPVQIAHVPTNSAQAQMIPGIAQPLLAASQCKVGQVLFLTTTGPGTFSNTTGCTQFTIETLGGGGGGHNGTAGSITGDGGGSSVYAKITLQTLASGANFGYSVGAAGVHGTSPTAGGDTWFCNATTNCATIGGTAVVVGSKAGSGGNGSTGGAGGLTASSVGTTKTAGCAGGTLAGSSDRGASGGGGAPGPHGACTAGGPPSAVGSGGGAGGGADGSVTAPVSSGSNNGAAGGTNRSNTGGGSGGVSGNPPTVPNNASNGGGGGGGGYPTGNVAGQKGNGSTGSVESVWTETATGHVAGPAGAPGGGAPGDFAPNFGGDGGACPANGYGAGGAGGGGHAAGFTPGVGSDACPGIIVLTTTGYLMRRDVVPAAANDNRPFNLDIAA